LAKKYNAHLGPLNTTFDGNKSTRPNVKQNVFFKPILIGAMMCVFGRVLSFPSLVVFDGAWCACPIRGGRRWVSSSGIVVHRRGYHSLISDHVELSNSSGGIVRDM
jgi:hypothetical protein